MLSKEQILGITSCLLSSSLTIAGETGSISVSTLSVNPIISLLGGVGGVTVRHSQTNIGNDEEMFFYNNRGNTQKDGFVGAFLGVEHVLSNPLFFMQTGVEYNYFDSVNITGWNTAGNDPLTYTRYNYQYHLQSQQILGVAKAFATVELPTKTHHRVHPYVSVGLGAAMNKASQFNASTQESGSMNLTPAFNNNTYTAFSYNLGLGVETAVNQHVRMGLGYRYASFGKAALGNGYVAINNYTFPVLFTLSTSHVYANQFVAQISYLI